MAHEQEKEAAARASLQFVKDGQVVGLGTGSTAAFFIELLAEQVKNGLRIRGIPTSLRSQQLALSLGIPLITLDDCQEIAVTVDGADEVDPQLRLIKGGGGAMLREKVVASATKQLVIVADASKQVPALGKFPLPVEVIPFAQALVMNRIQALGADVRLRTGADGKPFVTDERNHILDCRFGEIRDPEGLARQLSDMPGAVEHGLFIGMASVALFARGSEIVELRR
ncbi:MAG: ribose-5-phosphate isomerase RpiA [Candidatus Sulfotelmatobacter sp.]